MRGRPPQCAALMLLRLSADENRAPQASGEAPGDSCSGKGAGAERGRYRGAAPAGWALWGHVWRPSRSVSCPPSTHHPGERPLS